MQRDYPKYLAWIRQQPCWHCEAPPPSDPHHIKGLGHFSGTGLKAPDIATVPLCRRCHTDMHNFPGLWPEQWEMVATTLIMAFEEGIIGVIDGQK